MALGRRNGIVRTGHVVVEGLGHDGLARVAVSVVFAIRAIGVAHATTRPCTSYEDLACTVSACARWLLRTHKSSGPGRNT